MAITRISRKLHGLYFLGCGPGIGSVIMLL
jgi:hypothetical protein